MDTLFSKLYLLIVTFGALLIVASFVTLSALQSALSVNDTQTSNTLPFAALGTSISNSFHAAVGRLHSDMTLTVGHVCSGTVTVLQIPSSILESVENMATVSAVIRPADHTRIPIINSPPPAVLAASASTPKAETVMPAAPPTPAPTPPPAAEAIWPMHGAITTLFGASDWPYQRVHSGLDISDGKAAGITPIHPYKPGQVIQAVRSNLGLGNHVAVDHGGGVTSVYGHLASISATVGQPVDASSILGYEGSTGNSTGTHLHFEIRLSDRPVDPLLYISGRP